MRWRASDAPGRFWEEGGGGEGPFLEAGEAVGGAGLAFAAVGKPWKANGYAAADGFAGGEVGARGEIEDGLLAGGLPVRDVGAVEVDGGGGVGQGDLGAGELAVGVEVKDAGEAEVLVEFGDLHGGYECTPWCFALVQTWARNNVQTW